MPTGARALGRLFNVAVGTPPTDTVAGASTGNRISMKNCETVTFVVTTSAGSTDVLDVDLQEHTAATSGTSRDLDIITSYFYASEATLDADETWTVGSQSAASEITDVGAASEQIILVIEVGAEQLSDDCAWVSLNVPDQGTNGTKWTNVLAIQSGLRGPLSRKPASMATAQA
jgi:hypothetical protein